MDKIIAAGYNTLDSLRKATPTEFEAIDGIGDITAELVSDGLKDLYDDMDDVLKTGKIAIKTASSGTLEGKSFCFTGRLNSIKRADAEALVKELGGLIKKSVSKGLTYLVTNDPTSGSAKNEKAKQYGTLLITEEKFLDMTK